VRFLSVCSGIEAASVAWSPLGWKAAAFSEIEPFPSAVLAHHYPDVPNLGDMTRYKEWPDLGPIDLLCGGTPCQSFSNAGLRAGLDDPRGSLMLTFGAIAARYRPRWLVWENVPGVLSSGEGRDFGSFLGLLARIGYGFAYRVLDAQFVRVDGYPHAVPQRRNRVFVVGCLGDWRSAAAVLLERESLRGDPAPRRVAGARVAATLTRGAESSGKGGYAGRRQEDDTNIVAATQRANSGRNHIESTYVTHALTGEGFDASEDGTGRGTPLIAAQVAPTLDASYGRLQGASGQDANHGHAHLVSMCLNAKGGGGATGRGIGDADSYERGCLR
jgi:DNA (cytosine-5)-methyltransferase 1